MSLIDRYPHLECDICDCTCSTKGNLKNHVESVHEARKLFKCDICDYYSCSQKGSLKLHVESVHKGKKPFKCEICDYIVSLFHFRIVR